jgi:hypothetical protein
MRPFLNFLKMILQLLPCSSSTFRGGTVIPISNISPVPIGLLCRFHWWDHLNCSTMHSPTMQASLVQLAMQVLHENSPYFLQSKQSRFYYCDLQFNCFLEFSSLSLLYIHTEHWAFSAWLCWLALRLRAMGVIGRLPRLRLPALRLFAPGSLYPTLNACSSVYRKKTLAAHTLSSYSKRTRMLFLAESRRIADGG